MAVGHRNLLWLKLRAIIGSDNGLSPGQRQAIFWNIVNWTLRNKLQWDLNQNSYILIQENAFENVFQKMLASLSRPQCVNLSSASSAHIQNSDLVITIPADGLAPNGARPSAGTVMTTKIDTFSLKLLWLLNIFDTFFAEQMMSFKMINEISWNLPALWMLNTSYLLVTGVHIPKSESDQRRDQPDDTEFDCVSWPHAPHYAPLYAHPRAMEHALHSPGWLHGLRDDGEFCSGRGNGR